VTGQEHLVQNLTPHTFEQDNTPQSRMRNLGDNLQYLFKLVKVVCSIQLRLFQTGISLHCKRVMSKNLLLRRK